jgi:hypothetical protein
MTAIPTNFGEGGANIAPGGAGGTPTLADTLRDVSDDLGTLRTAFNGALAALDIAAADPTAVSAGALAAFTDPPSAAEMANTRTLVNQLRTTAQENRTLLLEVKGDLNAAVTGSVASADPAAVTDAALGAFTDPPSAAEMAALRSLVNQIRTTSIANRTLAIEIKTVINAANFGTVGTLKTSKA